MSQEDVSARQVANRYTLDSQLGKGGMGVVWSATDMLLQRPVAIKQVKLPPSIPIADRDAMKARSTREARAAAQLNHPSVVTIFDVVEEDGMTWIVMELVRAPSLSATVRDEGTLDSRAAARIGLDVLDGLEAAHSKGIVHRDVKPGNVMVTADGRAKLADFGIASLKGDPKITTTGMIMGSPSFMAPEQAIGREAGPATDLWSLGATLYFATEGTPPFDKGQPIPTLTAVVHEDAPAPRGAGALGLVIAALMSKEAADRPEVEEARAMLMDVAEGRRAEISTRAHPAAVTTPDEPSPDRESQPPAASTWEEARPSGRGRGVLVALGLVVLLMGAVFAFFTFRGDEEPRNDPPRAANEQQQPGGGQQEPEQSDIGPTRTFEAGDTGYGVEVPSGWDERPQDSSRVDLVDPSTGDYLRIDWTDTPGEDALAAWEQLEASFAPSHDNYERLQMKTVEYQDSPTAALWEYRWTEGNSPLHAYNLGFVTGDGEYGFALNFVTDESNFEASTPLWDHFMESFGPTEG
ncbi:MAG: serine/threonine-protein kinase [Actinomycetota bacterium]